MPRTKLAAKLNKPNMLSATLRACKRSKGMSDSDIAEKLNCTREHVCRSTNQPVGNWKIKDLVAMCKVLEADPQIVIESILNSI